MQMAFKRDRHDTKSVRERCFNSTSQYYASSQLNGSTGPVERFSHVKPLERTDGVYGARFCDRCGIDAIDNIGLEMQYCMSCWAREEEAVSHESCIDKRELLWLLDNEDERHWRCKKCRSFSRLTWLMHVHHSRHNASLNSYLAVINSNRFCLTPCCLCKRKLFDVLAGLFACVQLPGSHTHRVPVIAGKMV